MEKYKKSPLIGCLQKGITDGKRAFIGPRIVQIDLTGKCNTNCIGCWVHSPFIKKLPPDVNLSLPFSQVKKLIKDLSRLGTEEIFLSGSGEPFLHPQILEIIELIKREGLRLNIITNFTLIDEEKAKRLIELGVDLLTASIWAATPETYVKTHPGTTKEDFYRVKENLKKLSQLKKKGNKNLPHVKVYNVICNLNYKEIQQMIDFALDTQVEFIEFQIMDIMEGQTSFLALSDEQSREIKLQFDALTEHRDLYSMNKLFSPTNEKELVGFSGRFMRIPQGFFLVERLIRKPRDQNDKPVIMSRLTCRKGIHSLHHITDEKNNIFTFTFPGEECKKYSCSSCPLAKNEKLKVEFLTILGFGSFMRRIRSVNIYEQCYEKDIIGSFPCYVGWIYSRILSNGYVIPCCKAVSKPLGNIYKNSFSDIWNSEAYQEFRYKARFLPKSDPYFKEINCYKSCDNLGMNLQVNESAIEDVNRKLQESEKHIEELQDTIKERQAITRDVDERLQESEKHIEELQDTIRDRDSQLRQTAQTLSGKETELVTTRNELLSTREKLEMIAGALRDIKSKFLYKLDRFITHQSKRIFTQYPRLVFLYFLNIITNIYMIFWQKIHKVRIFPGQ